MKSGAWKALGAIALACMVIGVAVAAFMGGCDHMLETTTGSQVYMACHWTFVAMAFVGVIGIVSAAASLLASGKEGRRIAAVVTLVVCAIALILPFDFAIGLCGNSAMACHQTALITRIVFAVCAVLALVQVAKADPTTADKPKMKL